MIVFCRSFNKAVKKLKHICNRNRLKRHGVVLSGKVYINGKIYLSNEKMVNDNIPKESIFIGSDVTINSGFRYNLIGGDSRTIFRTIDDGIIIIGNNVKMSNVSLVAFKNITIEDKVMIGGGVKIYDSDFHSLNAFIRNTPPFYNDICSKGVLIRKGAFIGAHSIVLKGVTIGTDSIVGAGSVVSCSIPDGEVWGGAPAKFIRKIK